MHSWISIAIKSQEITICCVRVFRASSSDYGSLSDHNKRQQDSNLHWLHSEHQQSVRRRRLLLQHDFLPQKVVLRQKTWPRKLENCRQEGSSSFTVTISYCDQVVCFVFFWHLQQHLGLFETTTFVYRTKNVHCPQVEIFGFWLFCMHLALLGNFLSCTGQRIFCTSLILVLASGGESLCEETAAMKAIRKPCFSCYVHLEENISSFPLVIFTNDFLLHVFESVQELILFIFILKATAGFI